MLVFDTETRIDAAQALTFGSYRFFDDGVASKKGCSMPTICRAPIAQSSKPTSTHAAATDRRLGVPELRLLSRTRIPRKALYRRLDKTRA